MRCERFYMVVACIVLSMNCARTCLALPWASAPRPAYNVFIGRCAVRYTLTICNRLRTRP